MCQRLAFEHSPFIPLACGKEEDAASAGPWLCPAFMIQRETAAGPGRPAEGVHGVHDRPVQATYPSCIAHRKVDQPPSCQSKRGLSVTLFRAGPTKVEVFCFGYHDSACGQGHLLRDPHKGEEGSKDRMHSCLKPRPPFMQLGCGSFRDRAELYSSRKGRPALSSLP